MCITFGESSTRLTRREGGDKVLLNMIGNIELPDLNGKMVSTHDFRGKHTLIYMWASW